MTDQPRSIELEVEVEGTPEEVWRAIATGPGITSWYVPHTIEERTGGDASASFGPGMDVPGRVVEFDRPNRFVLAGVEGESPGLAFEWTIEAKSGGTCVVRLVNSGFGQGGEWDDHFDSMTEGWRMFLLNLQLHLAHFGGQSATAMLPMAAWAGPPADAWARLTGDLGLPSAPAVGDRVTVTGDGVPELAGEVVEVTPTRMSLLVDSPAPGTAFVAAEGSEDAEVAQVSTWCYLYGDEGAAAVARDESAWRSWFAARAVDAG
ncbi:MAG: SRPBCC domain-containing protein [Actinomycetota bacterium]